MSTDESKKIVLGFFENLNAGNAAAALDALDAVASQLEADATAAMGRDANRLHALAETLKGRAARLR
jgi:hypothetical protein